MNTEYQDLWNKVIERLETNIAPQTFEETFADVKKVIRAENGVIFVLCPNDYIRKKLNSTYYKPINDLIKQISERNLKVTFVCDDDKKNVLKKEERKIISLNENYLNPNYTFDSFVVGESNRLAYLAALLLVDKDNISINAADYNAILNPFYIFGGVGLGKTHLMQAIGNYIADKNVDNKIVYVTANEFVDDYTKGARENDLTAFEAKYNNMDVLLIDDIQMLAKKDSTQQQFFKIFSEMDTKNKQIVITSDCPASALNGFMDRLRSRFQKGTIVNINAPDLRQRINILRRKTSELTTEELPEEVLQYIAENFVNNIRELEGALNRVLLLSKLYNRKPDLDLTKEALEPLKPKTIKSEEKKYENLLSVIANLYNITMADLLSSDRSAKYVLPRHIAMYILKENYKYTNEKIGYIFNGKDHTTVMNAVKKIRSEIKNNNEIKNMIELILKKCE